MEGDQVGYWGSVASILGLALTLYVAYEQVQIKKNLINNHIHKQIYKSLGGFLKLSTGSISFTEMKQQELLDFLEIFEKYYVSKWHFMAKWHLNKIREIKNMEANKATVARHLAIVKTKYQKWWEMNP